MKEKCEGEDETVALRLWVSADATPFLWPAFRSGSAHARRERAMQLLTLGYLLEQSLTNSLRQDLAAALTRVLRARPPTTEALGHSTQGASQEPPADGGAYLSQLGALLP